MPCLKSIRAQRKSSQATPQLPRKPAPSTISTSIVALLHALLLSLLRRRRPSTMHPAPLLKIRVTTRLLRRYPRRRVINEQSIQQIQSLLRQRADQRDILIPDPLGKAGLVVWERGDAGPVGFGGRAEDAEDLEDFVDFGVAGKERLASAHFGEDGTDGPHVHAGGVGAAAEEDLGGAVPEGDDLRGDISQWLDWV